MDGKAQAGLEYLMTYGWALILIATVIGILVAVVIAPSSNVTFTSSAPTKIMLKGGTQNQAGEAEVVAQNITGGKIQVKHVYLTGDYTGLATLNGTILSTIRDSNLMEVKSGETLIFEGMNYVGSGQVSGEINIVYQDVMGFTNNAKITARGTSPAVGVPLTECGDLGPINKKYYLASDLASAGECLVIKRSDVSVNCEGHTITGQGAGAGVEIYDTRDNASVKNCTITNYANGIQISGTGIGVNYAQITNNTLTGNIRGIQANGIDYGTFAENDASNNTTAGITFVASQRNLVKGNTTNSQTDGKGIDLVNGCTQTIISGNTSCYNSGQDIDCDHSSNVVGSTGNIASNVSGCTGLNANTCPP